MAPIAAAVAAATVADTAHELYDDDCPENASVTLVEHAADQARLANLKVKGIFTKCIRGKVTSSFKSFLIHLPSYQTVFF